MSTGPFGPEFADAFDVEAIGAQAFNSDFNDQFDTAAGAPPPAALPMEWRLWVRANGIDRDITANTRFDFTVETGRDDPNELPDPGRASFTLDAFGAERLQWLSPGVWIWLEARPGGGLERDWQRVWTGTVTDVRRTFRWVGDNTANTLSIDATGPLAVLERMNVPAKMAGAYPEQLDGVRVWKLLLDLGLPLSTVRPEVGHLVNDELPEHAARWDAVTRTVSGATWAVFTRTTAVPAVTGQRRLEVVVTLTTTRAAIISVNVGGQSLQVVEDAPGTHTVSGAIELPANDPSPYLQVVAVPLDDLWSTLRWPDLGAVTWAQLPADQSWYAPPDASQSTTVTLHSVDVWRTGWDWGAVWLIARDPTANENQTALDHIEEIAQAARGTLWEQRDGGLSWASQLSRSSTIEPSLDLPARYIVAETESTQTLSGLVNDVTVEYGWEGITEDGDTIPRPSVHLTDQGSIGVFGGTFAATIAGPLRDRKSAQAVAQAVLRANARPRERLSQLQTIDVNAMDEATRTALLTLPAGAVIEVEGAPPGWVPSGAGRWRGFAEGWTLTGGTNRSVSMTLAISEWFESVATQVALDPGDRLLKGYVA